MTLLHEFNINELAGATGLAYNWTEQICAARSAVKVASRTRWQFGLPHDGVGLQVVPSTTITTGSVTNRERMNLGLTKIHDTVFKS